MKMCNHGIDFTALEPKILLFLHIINAVILVLMKKM